MKAVEKQILRERMRAALRAFSGKEAASECLRTLLRATLAWQAARVIYGFSPLASEPGWLGMEGAEDKTLAFPKVEGGTMRFFSGGKMIAGVFNIQEPDAGEAAPPPDLVLVPGLAFDKTGARLGRGGGYYDRWLHANPHVKTLGLCFACQIAETLPTEGHDAKVDAVLTECGLIEP